MSGRRRFRTSGRPLKNPGAKKMEAKYFNQVLFCSGRKGRVFRREILVSAVSALITRVEQLPPGYEIVLARMRRENEAVLNLPFLPKVPDDYACPYCFNQGSFHCTCGALSCLSRDARHTVCPACGLVHQLSVARTTAVSDSGFTFEQRQLTAQDYIDMLAVKSSPAPRPGGQKLLAQDVEPMDEEDEARLRGWLQKRKK